MIKKVSKAKRLESLRQQERLERVSKLYLSGKSITAIAESEQLKPKQIFDDLRLLRSTWRKRNSRKTDKLASEEVAKLDRAEQAAWEGWERSCQNAEETTTTTGGEESAKVTKKIKGQSGDASFLAIVAKIIDQRCKLLKIGQYSNEDTGTMVGKLVEIVVENADQVGVFLDYGDYEQLSSKTKTEAAGE